MLQANNNGPTPKEQITVAVAVVAASAVINGLVSWAMHELREKFGSKPKPPEPKPEPKVEKPETDLQE